MATIKDGKGTLALAAFDKSAVLKPREFGRPSPGPNDVQLDIMYCGMCHSDLHSCNGDWGVECFPVTPGHEIAGVVTAVGSNISKFTIGDKVGVGCFVYSCGNCKLCKKGLENYCSSVLETYAFDYPKGIGHDECAGCATSGGYSTQITVPETFVFAVPENIPLEYVGPLMCAGITMWTPLEEYVLQKGATSVGIVGFGGLGQMGAKLAKAMGASVTVLSRSTAKKDQAEALGAEILAHSDEAALKEAAGKFDVIIDTVAVKREIAPLFDLLTVGGTYHCIGGIVEDVGVSPFGLIGKNIHLTGSLVGGVPATQSMLEFCSKHEILPTIEVIPASKASAQFEAFSKGEVDAKRYVIDMSTLKEMF